eukprot:2756957-Prymnesium_polylepis.1
MSYQPTRPLSPPCPSRTARARPQCRERAGVERSGRRSSRSTRDLWCDDRRRGRSKLCRGALLRRGDRRRHPSLLPPL